MGLPVGDWQFWVGSLVALVAAGWLLRGALPMVKRRRKQRSVTLTIEGEKRDD